MAINVRPTSDSADEWRQSWDRHRSGFFLHQTQQSTPDKWMTFYDEIGTRTPDIWKSMGNHGDLITDFLFRSALITSGETVLDVGCGVGTLLIPLAERAP